MKLKINHSFAYIKDVSNFIYGLYYWTACSCYFTICDAKISCIFIFFKTEVKQLTNVGNNNFIIYFILMTLICETSYRSDN